LLKALPNLEELNCHYGGVDDSFSDCLPHLPKLKRLILFGTDVTGKSIQNISTLSNLEYLRIARKLPKADFPDEYISDHSLEQLAEGCPNLEHLYIGSPCNITDEGLWQIAKLKKLKELYIVSDHISPNGVDYLRTLSHIEDIGLYSGTSGDGGPTHVIVTGTQRLSYKPPKGTVYPPVKEATP
jgi:hypothetical protein